MANAEKRNLRNRLLAVEEAAGVLIIPTSGIS